MLVGFEPLDFMSQDKFFALLDTLNIPYPIHPNVVRLTIETDRIIVTEKHGDDVNSVVLNPNDESSC